MPSKHPHRQMEKLKKQVLGCRECPLHQQRNMAVFGEGPYDSQIMVIGEGPGAKEDELGRPFVGRAGRLLDELLEEQDLSRDRNVFIANIVKCRPPKNRVPHKKEIQTCFPYLEEQISLVDPSIMILLGATAMKAYWGSLKEKVGDVRGRWITEGHRHIMPTYHPAAVFRNRSYRQYIAEDLKTIAGKYRELVAG